MGYHRNPSPSPEILARILEDTYTIYATTPPRYDDPRRLIGVDRLTATVLEQRMALEGCRA